MYEMLVLKILGIQCVLFCDKMTLMIMANDRQHVICYSFIIDTIVLYVFILEILTTYIF